MWLFKEKDSAHPYFTAILNSQHPFAVNIIYFITSSVFSSSFTSRTFAKTTSGKHYGVNDILSASVSFWECSWVMTLTTNVLWNHKGSPIIYERSKAFQQVRSCFKHSKSGKFHAILTQVSLLCSHYGIFNTAVLGSTSQQDLQQPTEPRTIKWGFLNTKRIVLSRKEEKWTVSLNE